MLVLTRYAGQSIKLYLEDGSEIDIALLDIREGPHSQSARIGINAPKKVNILRQELILPQQ